MTRTKAQRRLAIAFFNESIVLIQIGQPQDAIRCCERVVADFSNSPYINVQEIVGECLTHKAIALGHLKHHVESLAIYDSVIDKWSSSDSLKLQYIVARATYNKAVLLADELEQLDEAIPVFEHAAQMYTQAQDMKRRGNAMIRRAHSLGRQGKIKDALSAYQEIRLEFEPRLMEFPVQVATAWLNQSLILTQKEDYEGAIALSQQVVDHFHKQLPRDITEGEEASDIRRIVANAWINMTADLAELGRESEKISVCQEIVKEFQRDEDQHIRTVVARTLFNQARGYDEEGEADEAIQCYREVKERFEDDPYEPIQEAVAQSLVNLGTRLEDQGRIDEAIEVDAHAWQKYRYSASDELKRQAYMALANKTRALTKQPSEMLKLEGCEEIVQHAIGVKRAGCEEALAMALHIKAQVQVQQGDIDGAIEQWKTIIEICGDSPSENTHNKVFSALEFLANAYNALGSTTEEKHTYLQAIELFNGCQSHGAYKAIIWAHMSLGAFLEEEELDKPGALKLWKEGLNHPEIDSCVCFGKYKRIMQRKIALLEESSDGQEE